MHLPFPRKQENASGCHIVETVDGMFPESRTRHWTVQYRVGDHWYPEATRSTEAEAQTIYDSWSGCSHFNEVVMKDSEAGIVAVSYPSEGLYLGPLGEQRARV